VFVTDMSTEQGSEEEAEEAAKTAAGQSQAEGDASYDSDEEKRQGVSNSVFVSSMGYLTEFCVPSYSDFLLAPFKCLCFGKNYLRWVMSFNDLVAG